MMRILISIFLVSLLGCSSSPKMRSPASAGDPCHEAMRALLYQSTEQSSESTQFIDEIIDQTRLVESEKLTQADIDKIETSTNWNNFFAQSSERASGEEQVMVAALLRKADPDAPIEAVQRKYRLLFEFCGL